MAVPALPGAERRPAHCTGRWRRAPAGVVVLCDVGRGAKLQEQVEDLTPSVGRSKMESQPPAQRGYLEVRTRLAQEPCAARLTGLSGRVQRALAVLVDAIDVRARLEQKLEAHLVPQRSRQR